MSLYLVSAQSNSEEDTMVAHHWDGFKTRSSTFGRQRKKKPPWQQHCVQFCFEKGSKEVRTDAEEAEGDFLKAQDVSACVLENEAGCMSTFMSY